MVANPYIYLNTVYIVFTITVYKPVLPYLSTFCFTFGICGIYDGSLLLCMVHFRLTTTAVR